MKKYIFSEDSLELKIKLGLFEVWSVNSLNASAYTQWVRLRIDVISDDRKQDRIILSS